MVICGSVRDLGVRRRAEEGEGPRKADAVPKLKKAGSVTVTAYHADTAVCLRNTNDVIIELHAGEKSGLAAAGGANGILAQFED